MFWVKQQCTEVLHSIIDGAVHLVLQEPAVSGHVCLAAPGYTHSSFWPVISKPDF
jgi:hypothetical protein